MINKNITISILIPVYNVEAYVEECVDSILAQVDDRASIIMMNDASTDNGAEVVKRYQGYPQVQILEAPCNRGLSATRNSMFQLVESDYVWFIDSDDVMYENAYASVMSQIEVLGSDIVCADYVSLRKNKEVKKKAFIGTPNKLYNNIHNSFLDNVIKNNSNHVWNKVFRRSVIQHVSFQEGLNFEDILYMTDIASAEFSYCYLNMPIIKYRERDDSIVKSLSQKYIDDYLGAFMHRVEKYPNADKYNEQYIYLIYKVYKRYVSLIFDLKKTNQQELILYTCKKYDDYFFKLFNACTKEISWYRKKILYRKKSQLDGFFK